MNLNKIASLLSAQRALACAALFLGAVFMGAGGTHSSGAMFESAPPDTQSAAFGYFHPLTPHRILDTRTATGGHPTRLGPESTMSVRVTGVGGVPAAGVSAVVVNVTVTEPTAASHFTVFPSGEPRPNASNLNFVAGQTVPNLVNAKVGAEGMVNVFNQSGSAHVIFDVVGYIDNVFAGSAADGQAFTSLPPARILDTRTSVGGHPFRLGAGETMSAKVTGVGGVPGDGVSAVLVNTTITEPTAPGFLTVFPSGVSLPLASSLNFVNGQTVANLVVARVGPGGMVNLYNSSGQTHVIFDVVGWFGPAMDFGGQAGALTPARILDTRTATGGHPGKLAGGSTMSVQVAGAGGVPKSGVAAVIMNVAVTEPTAASHLTVFPSGAALPNASSLNFAAGQTVPNLVTVKLGPDGKINVFNFSGEAHVIFDVVGFYASDSAAVPPPPGDVPPPPTDSVFSAGSAADFVVRTGGDASVAEIEKFWTPERLAMTTAMPLPESRQEASADSTALYAGNQPSYSISSQGYMPADWYSPAVGRILFYVPPRPTSPGGGYASCSGTVVARNLVLTAAHCVTDAYRQTHGDYTNFAFIPGQIGNSAPKGNWYTDKAVFYTWYLTVNNPVDAGQPFYAADYALLVFQPQNGNQYIGDTTGFFQIMADAPGGNGWSIGYPSEGDYFGRYCTSASSSTNSCYQFYCYSPIAAYVKHYDGWYEKGQGCNISGGHSGGPIFQYVNGKWYVSSVNSNAPTLEYDANGQRRFSKNIWGPYFNSWIISLFDANAVR